MLNLIVPEKQKEEGKKLADGGNRDAKAKSLD